MASQCALQDQCTPVLLFALSNPISHQFSMCPPRLLINKTRQINLIGAPNLYSQMLHVSLSFSLLYHFYHFEIVTNNIILL
jgi:hypothetical protein